jgi:hypothetical protein
MIHTYALFSALTMKMETDIMKIRTNVWRSEYGSIQSSFQI